MESNMSNPQEGDMVILYYKGRLDNGELFKEVSPEEPVQATLGNSEMPPTLELAVQEMVPGETRKVRVPPEEGFGIRQKELLQTIEHPEIIKKLDPRPGMILSLKVEKDGAEQQIPATVVEREGNSLTVDYNHPLAGHHLTYEVTLVSFSR
jgi:FKBP-type peptidyl-prolyl cis-trans isomerase 2